MRPAFWTGARSASSRRAGRGWRRPRPRAGGEPRAPRHRGRRRRPRLFRTHTPCPDGKTLPHSELDQLDHRGRIDVFLRRDRLLGQLDSLAGEVLEDRAQLGLVQDLVSGRSRQAAEMRVEPLKLEVQAEVLAWHVTCQECCRRARGPGRRFHLLAPGGPANVAGTRLKQDTENTSSHFQTNCLEQIKAWPLLSLPPPPGQVTRDRFLTISAVASCSNRINSRPGSWPPAGRRGIACPGRVRFRLPAGRRGPEPCCA